MAGGGTGQKLANYATWVAAVASLAATLLSIISIWLQSKNYRKPLLQRYVVRILLMVPIYSFSSWASMVSRPAAAFLDPIRDIYEAFTIYTFFQLLIGYIGGERALIIMMHGREPVHHLWPMNHFFERVDISDPYTFLAIKRGILQYAWLKPVLALAAVIMQATDTYHEGVIATNSGYLWSGIIYNISVSLSLYSLGLFWVCMNNDLKPFRPMPKFLCIKLIIFASYWQGFLLSILVWLGVLPDQGNGYTADNLAAAIQDFLICIEMPGFAIAHWYAFSWHDYADNRISAARMPVWFAIRDAFGIRDLIQDSKETFSGDKYGYRIFDSGDKIMAHEASKSRLARLKDGMRYERGGKGKYWIPKPDEINQTTPLLGAPNGGPSRGEAEDPHINGFDELVLDPDEEHLYDKARKLEFGDWNYPVISANEPSREQRLSPHPSLYQHTPTGSFYQHTPTSSASLDSTNPLARKMKRAPEGPEIGPTVTAIKKAKAKRKAKGKGKGKVKGSVMAEGPSSILDPGKDPLEIAYGPTIGTHPEITEDDFKIDPGDTSRKQPSKNDEDTANDDHESPIREESGQWERHNHSETGSGTSSPYNLGGAEEFQNVWGK